MEHRRQLEPCRNAHRCGPVRLVQSNDHQFLARQCGHGQQHPVCSRRQRLHLYLWFHQYAGVDHCRPGRYQQLQRSAKFCRRSIDHRLPESATGVQQLRVGRYGQCVVHRRPGHSARRRWWRHQLYRHGNRRFGHLQGVDWRRHSGGAQHRGWRGEFQQHVIRRNGQLHHLRQPGHRWRHLWQYGIPRQRVGGKRHFHQYRRHGVGWGRRQHTVLCNVNCGQRRVQQPGRLVQPGQWRRRGV